MIRRKFILGLLLASAALMACKGPVKTDTVSIYLVRHAEKQKGDDPALTEAGKVRAEALKNKLSGKGITHIHSSNYRRTLETAAPIASALGLEVLMYDPSDLLGITETIKTAPGVHLVVGHSNTTPELAALLSGQIMDRMPETEYDRLIEIQLGKNGALDGFEVTTYGAKSSPKNEDP